MQGYIGLGTLCYIKLQTIIFLSICGIYMFQLGCSYALHLYWKISCLVVAIAP